MPQHYPSSRFPIVAGMEVDWDHTRPPGQRVLSIRLVKTKPILGDDPDDPDDDPADRVHFVEQEDGTRVEVRQRPKDILEEIKNVEGGRVYRCVSMAELLVVP